MDVCKNCDEFFMFLMGLFINIDFYKYCINVKIHIEKQGMLLLTLPEKAYYPLSLL